LFLISEYHLKILKSQQIAAWVLMLTGCGLLKPTIAELAMFSEASISLSLLNYINKSCR